MENIVIGIEGLVGAGKTSICRQMLDIIPNTVLVNGGNIYRSIVYAMMQNGEKIEDIETSRTNDFSLKELYDVEEIPEDYYFVMGDNRGNSLDSRDYRVGLVKKDDIVGTTGFRLFPFNKLGTVK